MDERNEAMVTEKSVARELTPMEKLEADLASKQKEIEDAKEEIKKLKEEQARLEKIKGYDKMSEDIKDIHNSLMTQGFTDEQAFEILIHAIDCVFTPPSQ